MTIMRGGIMRGGVMRGSVMRGGVMRSQWDWTPAQLFAGGWQGFYTDPVSGLYLFSDTAGAAPAPIDGTVARLDAPPGSPVAASFTNATVSKQPIRRVDGLEFDGVDDRLSYPDDPALRFGTTDFTVYHAFKYQSGTGFHALLHKHATKGWNIGVLTDENQFRLEVVDGSGASSAYSQVDAVAPGQWLDVGVELDRTASKMRIFINNTLNNEVTRNVGDISDTTPLAMGSHTTSPTAYLFAGTIGRTFAIDRLLTPAERAKLNAWLKESHS